MGARRPGSTPPVRDARRYLINPNGSVNKCRPRESRDRSAPAKRRARERVREFEGRSPSNKTMTAMTQSATNVVLALAATVAVNAIRRPRMDTAGQVQEIAESLLPPAPPMPVVDISRHGTPWRWTSVLLAPIELLALAWSVPVLILLVMVPIGLVLAAALWVGRLILGR